MSLSSAIPYQEVMKKNVEYATRDIGENLKIIRKKLNKSQDDLAKMLGVSYQQIQKYENGTDRISAGALIKIAQGLKRPIIEFFPTEHRHAYQDTVTLYEPVFLSYLLEHITHPLLKKHLRGFFSNLLTIQRQWRHQCSAGRLSHSY